MDYIKGKDNVYIYNIVIFIRHDTMMVIQRQESKQYRKYDDLI